MYGIIYKATCLPTGKIYIGQTVQTLQKRWQGHLYNAKYSGNSSYWLNTIRKYGSDAFTVEQIDCAHNQQKLNKLEQFYIKHFDSFKTGYNGTTGGEHPRHSKQSRIRQKVAMEQFWFNKTCE